MKKITYAAVFGVLAACGGKFDIAENITGEASGAAVMSSKVDLNLHPMNKTVCDPFDGNQTQVMTQGIQGTLYYKTSAMAALTSLADLAVAKKSDKSLFFVDINVPTRLFDQGFSTQTTGVLKDDDGNKLIENFGIKFESNIQLTDDDQEGLYEFATLSDDGSRLSIQDPVDNTWKELINNDQGIHPTRMGCSSVTVNMTRRTSLPMILGYFQGPRTHIANVLIWRKVAQAGQDPLCGTTGNDAFFDFNNGSAPMKNYNDLLARGWKPLVPGNFWINGKGNYNPCVEGTAPVISNLSVGEISFTEATLIWNTDIPASSQIRFVNVATGEEVLTAADNMLRTSHSVKASGLKPGSTYTAQAVSISADLGKTISNTITFSTP